MADIFKTQDYSAQRCYFIKNQQNLCFLTTNYWNINFPRGWYFLNAWLFYINTLLFCQKSAKFGIDKINFLCGSYFKMYDFFWINTLLFRQKLRKLATICKGNFSYGWYLLDAWLSNISTLFRKKLAKFTTKCRLFG